MNSGSQGRIASGVQKPAGVLFTATTAALPGAVTVLAFGFLVGVEWLFMITKPSFMSDLGFGAQATLFLQACLPGFPAGVLAIGLVVLAYLARPLGRTARVLGIFSWIPAAFLFGTALFLLIDNFTYTLFGFGALNVKSPWHRGYLLLHALLIFWCWRRAARLAWETSAAGRWAILVAAALLVAVSSAATTGKPRENLSAVTSRLSVASGPPSRRPNIIVFLGDGITANHVSLYGYERDTTPFLRSLASGSIIAENCISSAHKTFPATAMLLTGRLPTASRLVFEPSILKGVDAYRHLPGLLRGYGYRSINISTRHYADPFDMNMRNSFDRSNSRDESLGLIGALFTGALDQQPAFLLQEIYSKLQDRFSWAYLGLPLNNAFAEATQKKTDVDYRDSGRIAELYRYIDTPSPKPFFAYVHTMATHGPWRNLERKVLSDGLKKDEDPVSYDDAILGFDNQVRELVSHLKEKGLFENTLLVVLSDHGPRGGANQRIPLLFHFPGGLVAGRVRENTQLTDVAPTILDYLGVRQPLWMEGISLLGRERDRFRGIFGASYLRPQKKRVNTPPEFEGLAWISVALCHRSYALNLETRVLDECEVTGHTAPCTDEPAAASARRAEELLRERLLKDGYPLPGSFAGVNKFSAP